MGFFKRTIKDKTIKTIHFFKWRRFFSLGVWGQQTTSSRLSEMTSPLTGISSNSLRVVSFPLIR